MDRATVIMQQAKQVPDDMLLDMIDNATDRLEIMILQTELDARTAPKDDGLATLRAMLARGEFTIR